MDDEWFGSLRPSFDGAVVALEFFKAKKPTASSQPIATLSVTFARANGSFVLPKPRRALVVPARGVTGPADPSKFRIADPVPLEVDLVHEDGVSASMLQRFAWARWLAVAEAIARAGTPHGAGPHHAFLKAIGAKVATSRPGPKGHPRAFYEQIALRYRELSQTADGRHATARLAEDLHYNRNTMAGMVRRARELFPDLLPPARPGRSG